MQHSSSFRRAVGVTVGVLSVMWVSSSVVLASTIYPNSPSGDIVTLSAAPVTVTTGYSNETCTLGGESFTIPAAGKGGAITVNIGTPKFTGCSGTSKITTSGTWTLSAKYEGADVTVTAPAGGLLVTNSAGTLNWFYNGSSAVEFAVGGWNNGFSAPFHLASAVSYGGTVKNAEGQSLTLSQALQTMTDTTHPESLVLLGP